MSTAKSVYTLCAIGFSRVVRNAPDGPEEGPLLLRVRVSPGKPIPHVLRKC